MELTEIMPGIKTYLPSTLPSTPLTLPLPHGISKREFGGKVGKRILEWLRSNKPPYYTKTAAKEVYGINNALTRKKVGQYLYLLRKMRLTDVRFSPSYARGAGGAKGAKGATEKPSNLKDFMNAIEAIEKLSAEKRKILISLIS